MKQQPMQDVISCKVNDREIPGAAGRLDNEVEIRLPPQRYSPAMVLTQLHAREREVLRIFFGSGSWKAHVDPWLACAFFSFEETV